MTMTATRLTTQFIMIQCPCGRVLRAKWDQVNTEIQCWDCRETLTVVAPRAQARILGQMIRSVALLFVGEGTNQLVVVATLLTLGLLVPWAGLALAGLVLGLASLVYADIVRIDSDATPHFDVNLQRARRGLNPIQVVACVGLGVGTAGLLWLYGIGNQQSPHLGPSGGVLLAVCWTAAPLALVLFAIPAGGLGEAVALTMGDRIRTITRYPFLLVSTLLVVPLSLMACEVFLAGIFYLLGGLPTLALDYMPRPSSAVNIHGYVVCGDKLYTEMPPGQFIAGYWKGLRHGYTFVGAIPPSLSLSSRWGVRPENIPWTREWYALVRTGATFLVALTLILGFATQARCLSVLAHARKPFGTPSV